MSPDLAAVGAGLADPVFDSQRVFRACLEALSRPGSIVSAGPVATPSGVQPAAAALLLALLDHDTRLWLSPSCARAAVAATLRFHTGCTVVGEPQAADFALVAAPTELPALRAFSHGSDERPDRSASIVLQVPALAAGSGWRLRGPGIEAERRVHIGGLQASFRTEWEAAARAFPRGVDFYFCCGERLCALPRTTRIGD